MGIGPLIYSGLYYTQYIAQPRKEKGGEIMRLESVARIYEALNFSGFEFGSCVVIDLGTSRGFSFLSLKIWITIRSYLSSNFRKSCARHLASARRYGPGKWEEEKFRFGETRKARRRQALACQVHPSCRQILGGLHRIGIRPRDMKYFSCKVTSQVDEIQKLSHAKGQLSSVCQQRSVDHHPHKPHYGGAREAKWED